MSIEVTVGSGCNLSCGYCYENGERDAGNFGTARIVDFDALTRSLEAEGVGRPNPSQGPTAITGFGLHGGEPLLMPLADIARLAEWAKAKRAPMAVQTNGSLLTAAHLDLFAEYGIHVGFSLDGPGQLNDSRWSGSPEKTQLTTAKSFAALAACQARQVRHSVIVTLHRLNAIGPALDTLCDWFADLDAKGTGSVRLHTLEVDNDLAATWVLSLDEQIAAFTKIGALRLPRLTFDLFRDHENLLQALDDKGVTCVYHNCDPLTTDAVRSVTTSGARQNCARTYKAGVPMLKGETSGHERQLALYYTPQEHGGCAGCRFFLACKGHCYSADTEVLTADGFARFDTLTGNEFLATLNPASGALAYERPVRMIRKNFTGDLLHFSAQGYDMLVTPDHPMLLWSADGAVVECRADSIPSRKLTIRKDAAWNGCEVPEHVQFKNDPARISYDGLVYDVTMPTWPTIYTRRNGRSAWTHNCPGEGLDGDWRNRSASCASLKVLFAMAEQRLVERGVVPVTMQPARAAALTSAMIGEWSGGRAVTIARAQGIVAGTIAPVGADAPHGDAPHGDAPHGDHNDAS